MTTLFTLEIRYPQDVVQTRQHARQIAERLGFEGQDQVRLATAVSEIARNALQYAGGGLVEFSVESQPQAMLIRIRDQGPGIPHLADVLAGRYTSTTGMGMGIIGTRRLMDSFDIESVPGQGTTVVISKGLPSKSPILPQSQLEQIQADLRNQSPQNPYEEVQRQNQELLQAMAELRKREEELNELNRELEDTNRGVVALYAELDEKAESLQKANELKTRFLSNMSHEFRTPLNSILSLSRLLLARMDGDLSAEQEKQVTFIERAAEGLSELVNDLLDLAKVEAGKVDVYPTLFEASELFGTLRGMLRPLLAHNASIALIFEDPLTVATLHTDEGKVAQILRNFISNALKFTPHGEVRVTACQSNDMVSFSVADTGIGITPEDQERIFEDFVQIASQLQRKVKGTGLGLPLSRKLAELLGGTVTVKSELGKGSTFTLSIPVTHPSVQEVAPLPILRVENSRQPILVVEDHAETLFLYEKYFQESNYQLITASTLTQAQQALQQLRPAAIILDIMLEKQSGWTLLQAVKQAATTRTIPVLVVTVVNNEKQAIALGADGFLIKPVGRLLLLNKLNKLVKQDTPQKVLLIDDDPAHRYLVKQLLTSTPLTVVEATNGREGLELAHLEQPTAILLDLVMPEMNGNEVLTRLKNDPTTQSIPVIIHTSKQLEPEEQATLTGGSVAILSKETLAQAAAVEPGGQRLQAAQLQDALIKAGLVLTP